MSQPLDSNFLARMVEEILNAEHLSIFTHGTTVVVKNKRLQNEYIARSSKKKIDFEAKRYM